MQTANSEAGLDPSWPGFFRPVQRWRRMSKFTRNLPKHNVTIGSTKTSITLEDEFWSELKVIAKQRNATIPEIIAVIGEGRGPANLASAVRVFVLEQVQSRGIGD